MNEASIKVVVSSICRTDIKSTNHYVFASLAVKSQLLQLPSFSYCLVASKRLASDKK